MAADTGGVNRTGREHEGIPSCLGIVRRDQNTRQPSHCGARPAARTIHVGGQLGYQTTTASQAGMATQCNTSMSARNWACGRLFAADGQDPPGSAYGNHHRGPGRPWHPSVERQCLTTNVMMRDGATIAIGGPSDVEVRQVGEDLAFLKWIPCLNWVPCLDCLFGNMEYAAAKKGAHRASYGEHLEAASRSGRPVIRVVSPREECRQAAATVPRPHCAWSSPPPLRTSRWRMCHGLFHSIAVHSTLHFGQLIKARCAELMSTIHHGHAD